MAEEDGRAGTLMIRLLAAMGAAIIILGLVACSGGDGDDQTESEADVAAATTAAEPSLSKEEIIAQGDAICAEANAAIGGLEMADIPPATMMAQRTELYTGMIERLRGLDSEDPGLTDVFSAGRDLVQAASEAESSAAGGDTEAAVAAETTVTAALAAFRAAASNYGFSECGGPPDLPVTTAPETDGGAEAPSSEPETTDPYAPPEQPAPQGGAAAGGETPPADGGDGGTTGGGGAPAGGGTGDGGGGGGGGDGSSTGGFSPGG